MVKIRCRVCTGIGEGSTEAKAYDTIDHSIGLGKGRKCRGKDTDYEILEKSAPKETVTTTAKVEVKTTAKTTKKKRG